MNTDLDGQDYKRIVRIFIISALIFCIAGIFSLIAETMWTYELQNSSIGISEHISNVQLYNNMYDFAMVLLIMAVIILITGCRQVKINIFNNRYLLLLIIFSIITFILLVIHFTWGLFNYYSSISTSYWLSQFITCQMPLDLMKIIFGIYIYGCAKELELAPTKYSGNDG